MTNTNNQLSKHERLILALLEEAGEEHISALANTLEKRSIDRVPLSIRDLSIALNHLIDRDLIRVASFRDTDRLRLVPLSAGESTSIATSLDSLLEWSPTDQLWHWKGVAPIADVVLTESGMAAAREILSVDGWPSDPE